MRRILAGLVLLLTAIVVGLALSGSKFDAVDVPVPDPREPVFEWRTFPADGLFICRRVNPADSTKVTCLELPKGSFLWVPFLVKDSTRVQPKGGI